MTPPRERGKARPTVAPPLQHRPAVRAQSKTPAPEPVPNPVAVYKSGPEQPRDRSYRVVGPKAVGGVLAPGTVVLSLTDGQAEALESGGHVEPYDFDQDQDEPTAGADQEGN